MARSVSIWCKKTHSGRIRANQITNWAGWKLNPETGWEEDVCIFVKRRPCVKKNDWNDVYLDIIDDMEDNRFTIHLKKYSKRKVIAISQTALEYLTETLGPRIVLIPQHHCNFKREKRIRNEIKVVGFCGEWRTFAPFEEEIRTKLAKIGLELDFQFNYNRRKDVVDFYKRIDIQIIWRIIPGLVAKLKNPIKLSNGGSFRIPTVAFPEENDVKEYDGYFLPAQTIDELIGHVEDLKNDTSLYDKMASKCEERAEAYHISNIVEHYRKLAA